MSVSLQASDIAIGVSVSLQAPDIADRKIVLDYGSATLYIRREIKVYESGSYHERTFIYKLQLFLRL